MFDPEMFGAAMGQAIREAVAPLLKRIEELEARAPIAGKDGAPGKDGRDGQDGKDGAPGERGEKGADGINGQDGAAGKDGKSLSLDDISPILESAVSKWALEFERRAVDKLDKAIERIPVPKDGTNGADGKDGRDGLGFDDLAVEYDGNKTVTFKLERDGVTKEFNLVLPVVVDRGIFKDGAGYTSGDGVTWGGSYWVAQKDAPIGKPGEPGSDGWRLAVKRGRDGKDGRDGIDKTAPVKL